MTKNEIENKISMALKNPALQIGFEIICKKLSELEKENTELQDKLKNLSSVAGVRLANWQKYEKENAELKKRNGELAGQKASLERWLGEAKKIIKDYRIVATDVTACGVPEENRSINVLKLHKQAEQFLKEVEE